MSAIFHCRPWKSASVLSPTLRSFMYCTAYSSAPCAAPTHIAALPQRSWLMCEISVLNDSLFAASPHSNTSSGSMRTSSNASSASLVPRRPIFTCVPATVTPGRLEVDDDGADALGAHAVGEAAPHEARDRLVAAGHVVLVGVEAEAVTVGGEAGAHVADRASGLGLADADAEQAFAARRDGQPAVLHRVVAEVLDRARRAVEDELGEDRARHVGARELFEHDRSLDVAEPGAAPALTDRDAEQLGLAHPVPRPLRELFGLVAVARHRRELALGDVAGELAQRGLIFGVGERVGALACAAAVVGTALGAGAGMQCRLPGEGLFRSRAPSRLPGQSCCDWVRLPTVTGGDDSGSSLPPRRACSSLRRARPAERWWRQHTVGACDGRRGPSDARACPRTAVDDNG